MAARSLNRRYYCTGAEQTSTNHNVKPQSRGVLFSCALLPFSSMQGSKLGIVSLINEIANTPDTSGKCRKVASALRPSYEGEILVLAEASQKALT